MMYVDFTAGNRDYKLRLNTRNVVALEKQLGCNPISVFGDGETIPPVTDMVAILFHSAQQLNHGVSLNDAYDIFDAYLADGNQMTDFLAVIVDIYRVSGLIQQEEEDASEKNA